MWTKSSNFSVTWKQVGICLGGQFEQKHIRTYFLVMLHILRKSLWKRNPPATSPLNLSILFYPCKTKMKIGSLVFWSPKCSHWTLKNPLQSDKNNQSAIVSEGCWKCIKITCGPHLSVPYQCSSRHVAKSGHAPTWGVPQSTYRVHGNMFFGLFGPLGSHTTPDPVVFCMESWNLMQAAFPCLLYNLV